MGNPAEKRWPPGEASLSSSADSGNAIRAESRMVFYGWLRLWTPSSARAVLEADAHLSGTAERKVLSMHQHPQTQETEHSK